MHTTLDHPNPFEYNEHAPYIPPNRLPTILAGGAKQCQDGFILVDGLCIPDDEYTPSSSVSQPPPTPPTPPQPAPFPPIPMIIKNMENLDAGGILALAGIIGVDLTKDEISEILSGQTVQGITYNANGVITVDTEVDSAGRLVGRDGEVLFEGDDAPYWDSVSGVWRGTGEDQSSQLTPLLEDFDIRLQLLSDSQGDGIELTRLQQAAVDSGSALKELFVDISEQTGVELQDMGIEEEKDDIDIDPLDPVIEPDEMDPFIEEDILNMNKDELAEWKSKNWNENATPQEVSDYLKRQNQLADEVLNNEERTTELSYSDFQAMDDEAFKAFGKRNDLSTDEIQAWNKWNMDKTQIKNNQSNIDWDEWQSMTPDEKTGIDLRYMSDEWNRGAKDYVDTQTDDMLIAQTQFDDAIAQALAAGADAEEIEALNQAFAEGGIIAVEGATDLPITIMGATAAGLAYLSGDDQTRKEIAKDAGKSQSWIDDNIFEPAGDLISDTGAAIAEGIKEGKDIFDDLFGKKKKKKAVRISEPEPEVKEVVEEEEPSDV
tara:strand:+ start:2197 stop:3831 length:1635 start_codon:yes stop_codon:yes gene_type:complete